MELDLNLIIQGASTLATIFGVFILNAFKSELYDLKQTARELKDSTSDLNTNIAVLITSDKHKDEKIRDNKVSIYKLNEEQKGIREKVHVIGNEIHKVQVVNLKLDELLKKQ